MSYRSETIALAIGRMNRQYFLPAIQREFVWNPEQIVQLFDSIARRVLCDPVLEISHATLVKPADEHRRTSQGTISSPG